MPSSEQTPQTSSTSPTSSWRDAGRYYFSQSDHLRAKFGSRVHKVSLDARFTCPNVDGKVARGGCTFCDNRGFSPSRRFGQGLSISEQLTDGVTRLQRRFGCEKFIAYFQPSTNTYAPVETLRQFYLEALAHPQVVGLAISTRPDCVPPEVLDLLAELASQTYVTVEYGLQTIHNRSLDRLNRGHHVDAFWDAIQRSKDRGFDIGAHVILGLPDESDEDMLATGRALAQAGVNSVKLHNLYAAKNTRLGEEVAQGKIDLIDRERFVRVVIDIIEILPPTTVIERIGGSAPPDMLIGPEWCTDKLGLLKAIEAEFQRRDTWQGKKVTP